MIPGEMIPLHQSLEQRLFLQIGMITVLSIIGMEQG
jgi:hypothetical protein